MAIGTEAKETEAANPFQSSSDKIREAGKWLVAAVAAVGAAVIAGSQLSDIGSLPICRPTGTTWSQEWTSCARLPIAVAASAVALVSIAYVLWAAARLLVPVGTPLDHLAELWTKTVEDGESGPARKHWWRPLRGDIRFFVDHPEQIPASTPSLAVVQERYTAAVDAVVESRTAVQTAEEDLESLQDARAGDIDVQEARRVRDLAQGQAQEAADKLQAWNATVRNVIQTAGYELLASGFRRLLLKLIPGVLFAAVGLTAFAWASNPPDSLPPTVDLEGVRLNDADLRNASLVGANLDRADLSNARLEGADLSDASLRDVIWTGTTCPDGTKSEQNGRTPTCLGHLKA